jgi:hypothetical protein
VVWVTSGGRWLYIKFKIYIFKKKKKKKKTPLSPLLPRASHG